MSEEKKEESSPWGALALFGGILTLAIGIPVFAEVVWPRIHGATPADLARLPMTGSPKAFGKAAPASEVSGSSVRLHLKSAGEYERADISWPSDDTSAPNEIRLRAEHGAHQPDVAVNLGRWMPLSDDRYKWGAVSFRVDENDGEIRFTIERTLDSKPNPLFDRQVEAAREVLLNAAFGLPVTVSDAEIADTLGTGYPVAAVAKSEVFGLPIEQGPAFAAAHFPAATKSGSDSVNIPLDHPYVRSIRLRWANERAGVIRSIDLKTTDKFAGAVDAFVTCLTPKLGTATPQVTDYAAGKHNSVFTVGNVSLTFGASLDVNMSWRTRINPADWATILDAFDGCRESSESGSRSRRR